MQPAKVLFVLADGAHARLVARHEAGGRFSTLLEMNGEQELAQLRAELRASPAVANRQSGTPQRHSLAQEDFARAGKEAFVRKVAAKAADVARQRGFEHVFVAAPPRLVGPLASYMAEYGPVAGTLGRDLTKIPDAELSPWLENQFFA